MMLKLELVNKKRRPAKKYAITGIIAGILCIILIGIYGKNIGDLFKKILMCIMAFDFIICLFILNYSFKFKDTIGHISFSDDSIEVEILQKREIINFQDIRSLRFKLIGFEGLDLTPLSDLVIGFHNFFSYSSGLNNFIFLVTDKEERKFEFYVANKRDWISIQRVIRYYKSTYKSKIR